MLYEWLRRHIKWSKKTFGAGPRTEGVIKHIVSELKEIRADPTYPLDEWVDVLILGFDGAWRAGYGPKEIIKALQLKQKINFKREWPEIQEQDVAVFHIKKEKSDETLLDRDTQIHSMEDSST